MWPSRCRWVYRASCRPAACSCTDVESSRSSEMGVLSQRRNERWQRPDESHGTSWIQSWIGCWNLDYLSRPAEDGVLACASNGGARRSIHPSTTLDGAAFDRLGRSGEKKRTRARQPNDRGRHTSQVLAHTARTHNGHIAGSAVSKLSPFAQASAPGLTPVTAAACTRVRSSVHAVALTRSCTVTLTADTHWAHVSVWCTV